MYLRWLQRCSWCTGAEGADDSNTVAQHLLLDFLADRHQQKDAALFTSARSFLTCRLFADELTVLRSAGTSSNEQQLQLLRRYQTLTEQLDKGHKSGMDAGSPLSSESCIATICLDSAFMAMRWSKCLFQRGHVVQQQHKHVAQMPAAHVHLQLVMTHLKNT